MENSREHLSKKPSQSVEVDFDPGKFYSRAGILFFEVDAQGVIISMNSVAEETLACDESDCIGKELTLFVDMEHRNRLKLLVESTMNRGIVRDETVQLRSLVNESVSVLFNGLCQYDDSRNPVVLHLYLRDVTQPERLVRLNALATEVIKLLPLNVKSAPVLLEKLRALVSATYAGFSWPEHGRMHVIDPQGPPNVVQPMALSWPPGHWEILSQAIAQQQGMGRTAGGWSSDIGTLTTQDLTLSTGALIKSLEGIQCVAVWPVCLEDTSPCCYFYLLGRQMLELSEEVYAFIQSVAKHFQILGKPQIAPSETVSTPKEIDKAPETPVLGMMVVRDGIINHANRWMQKFLGCPLSALAGQRLLDLVSTEDQEKVVKLTGGGFAEEKDTGLARISLRSNHGEFKAVEAAFQTALVEGKLAQIWYFISKDDEQRLTAQLIQARKTEAMGLLAGGLVHDFNNLMACVLGYSSLLNEEINPESPYHHDIQQIHKTSEEASERMTRLMAYAQNKPYFVENLDLNQLIKEVAGILSRTSDKQISIRADLDDALQTLSADASQIQQVILQLALNAREAMPMGGKLLFKTQGITVGERGLWKNQGAKPGHYVQLSVSDTGQGMSNAAKERLFDPQFTTKGEDRGRGMGLAFVQEIVRAHGGFISIFSEPQKGSMIKVHFPVTPKANIIEETPAMEAPALGKETLLLIDEEKVLQETARKMLTRYGYKVIGAHNLNDAIGIYKKYQDRIDLVMLDIHVKGARVQRVVAKLKQLNPQVKLLAVTGKGERLSEEVLEAQRFLGQVEKPYQIRPLAQTIRTALNA